MGPSRALSPVLILIGASCPWPGLSFDSIVGLSRTLSCKQQRFHTWKGDVTLSLFAEDAVLETGNWGTSLSEMSSNVVLPSSTLPADTVITSSLDMLSEAHGTQGASCRLQGCVSRCSKAVFMEHPELQCYHVLIAIRTQLVESWLRSMPPFES